jgi:hypothetical protein
LPRLALNLNPPTSIFQLAGITGTYHHTWPARVSFLFLFFSLSLFY